MRAAVMPAGNLGSVLVLEDDADRVELLHGSELDLHDKLSRLREMCERAEDCDACGGILDCAACAAGDE